MTEAQACIDAKPCDVNITGGNGRCHSVPRTTAQFPPPSVAPINRAFENLCGRLSVTKSNPAWQKSLVCPEEGSALSQRRSAPCPDSTARLQIRQSRSIRCDLSEESRRRALRRPGESLLALSCCCSWCPSLNHTAGSLDRARLRLRPALAESPVPSSSATHPRLRPGSTSRRSTRHTLAAARGPWRLAAGPLPRPRGAPCRRPLPHEGRRDRGRRS